MDRAVFIHNTLRDFVSHLTFWVADDDIIVRHEECVADLTLCAERLARAGGAEDQAIGVLQFFPVYHNQVVGQSIQAIIQAFLAVVEQFLCGNGTKIAVLLVVRPRWISIWQSASGRLLISPCSC